MDSLSLLELNSLVRRSLEQCLVIWNLCRKILVVIIS